MTIRLLSKHRHEHNPGDDPADDPQNAEELLPETHAGDRESERGEDRHDDAIDLDAVDFETFEGVGLPERASWLAAAVLYGTAGPLFVALWLFTDTVPAAVGILGLAALPIALASYVMSRVDRPPRWAAHLRISVGLLIVGAGTLLMGDAHGATGLIILYPMVVPAFIFRPRVAAPYLVAGTAWITVTFLLIDEPTARGITDFFVLSALSVAMVASQDELRRVTGLNRKLAVRDPLTGVANLRQLRTTVGEAIAFAEQRGSMPFAVMAIDLDDFKGVNDRFSHTTGDEVLKAVANGLQVELADGDLLARCGGDEFMILALGTGLRDFGELAMRLRLAIGDARRSVCPEVTPTGSVGFTVYEPGDDVDAMLAQADERLCAAKLDAHPERLARHDDAPVDITAYRRDQHAGRGEIADRTDHLISGSSEEMAGELALARTVRRAIGTASSWRVIAILAFAGVASVFASLFTATGKEVANVALVGAGAGLALLTVLAFAAHLREGPARWFTAALVALTALITVAGFATMPLRPAFADLFLAPLVAAFYVLEKRRAAPWLLVSLVLFAATVITSDYPNTTARIAVMSVVMIVMAGLLIKAREVTRSFAEHAAELSVVDPLTGIANLRGLRRGATDTAEFAAVAGQALAIVTIDLDDFKSVNDRKGHVVGDRVLAAVAEALKDSVRGIDVVARRGGDEFAVLCSVDDQRSLDTLVVRINDRVAKARKEICPDLVSSVSIGVATLDHDESIDQFFERADTELHGAKERAHARRLAEARAGSVRVA